MYIVYFHLGFEWLGVFYTLLKCMWLKMMFTDIYLVLRLHSEVENDQQLLT